MAFYHDLWFRTFCSSVASKFRSFSSFHASVHQTQTPAPTVWSCYCLSSRECCECSLISDAYSAVSKKVKIKESSIYCPSYATASSPQLNLNWQLLCWPWPWWPLDLLLISVQCSFFSWFFTMVPENMIWHETVLWCIIGLKTNIF